MTTLQIWVDGACSPNPGLGGWGIYMKYGDIEKDFSGAVPNSTNNTMELLASIKALEQLKKKCDVIIYSDSNYVVQGITEWSKNWVKKNFKGIKNVELWKTLIALDNIYQPKWVWVKGHGTNAGNIRADELAVQARLYYLAVKQNPINLDNLLVLPDV